MTNLDLWRRSGSPLRDIDSLFDNFFKSDTPSLFSQNAQRALTARAEIRETPNAYILKFDIPGMKKEDIKIDLHENSLSVSGERKEEHHNKDDEKLNYTEVSYGSFMRTYNFPHPVDAEKVEATYEGGVLKLEVEKRSSSKARQILIK